MMWGMPLSGMSLNPGWAGARVGSDANPASGRTTCGRPCQEGAVIITSTSTSERWVPSAWERPN